MASKLESAAPVQARAHATRERLVAAAADLLGEVGVERLSTNLICARAGVTPPAFYRYFKDKYAILEELGDRLMSAQNEAMMPLLHDDAVVSASEIQALILESIRVTEAFPGGPWILRALRAVPTLQHVRVNSHRLVSALIARAVTRRTGAPGAAAALQARLLVDMGYAAIELAFDEPDLPPGDIAHQAARSLSALVEAMQGASGREA